MQLKGKGNAVDTENNDRWLSHQSKMRAYICVRTCSMKRYECMHTNTQTSCHAMPVSTTNPWCTHWRSAGEGGSKSNAQTLAQTASVCDVAACGTGG